MNKATLIAERTKNKRKLEPSSWKNINRIEIDIGNTVEHSMTLSICYLLLRNGVPAEMVAKSLNERNVNQFTFPDCIAHLISIYGQEFKKKWQRPVVVTEARFVGGRRRADLYVLDTGEKVEIETDHKVKKDDSITIYI